MRWIFASGFRAGLVLSIRWTPSELNYSDDRSRFFDSDYDPSKPPLHALAQRSARSSPARTSDQDCCSRSLMHQDAGEVDLTSKTHVQSDDCSGCTRHAAVVSSQRSSNTKNNCISSASCDSCAPVTLCGLPLGLVESQFLNESQTQRSSAGIDTVSRHVRSFTEVHDQCPDFLNSGATPSARRELSPSQKTASLCPTPKAVSCLKSVTMSKSLEELAREVARVQGQLALSPGSSASPWFAASCCCDGSFHRCLQGWRQLMPSEQRQHQFEKELQDDSSFSTIPIWTRSFSSCW